MVRDGLSQEHFCRNLEICGGREAYINLSVVYHRPKDQHMLSIYRALNHSLAAFLLFLHFFFNPLMVIFFFLTKRQVQEVEASSSTRQLNYINDLIPSRFLLIRIEICASLKIPTSTRNSPSDLLRKTVILKVTASYAKIYFYTHSRVCTFSAIDFIWLQTYYIYLKFVQESRMPL